MKGWLVVGWKASGRRTVERLDSAGNEVRADAAGEGEVIMSRLQIGQDAGDFAHRRGRML
jgi:hypothetical protein